MQLKWMAVALLGAITTHSHATLIFNDGSTHQISSPIFEDVRLENGSDLDIIHGGSIHTPADQPAVIASIGGASTITLSGDAMVTGGIDYLSWGSDEDAVIVNDTAQIVGLGEKFSGHGRGAVSGSRRVEVNGNARLEGADNGTQGGHAIDNTSSGAQLASVHGGEVIGGVGGQTGGNGIHGRIDNIHLDMSGGIVRGGDAGSQGGHGITTTFGIISGTISGGMISGGNGASGGNAIQSQDGGSILDISGGIFQGGNGGLYGGDAINSIGFHSSTISGGYFDAGAGVLDDGWLLHLSGIGHWGITGGLFGYNNIGNGFGIFNNATVDIHGWDLQLTDNLLTGYLLDGNWIEAPVSLAYNEFAPLGNLNIFNHQNVRVPEPGSLMLLAIGLAGIWGAKRKKAGGAPM
ncbi:MAG: PEP-CTERM sorting domain-containing protein [Candidatus Thiodiazotropha sp. (ex Clathrolucina costata)]|nr:PEP-CTERM sorting domain-containing protein [Candidatus Thiodiazotropha taylori]MCG7863652.1 PEP-CTERM sorting domain-containing protein [Candidatus Thiodiazotropha endolucinida]